MGNIDKFCVVIALVVLLIAPGSAQINDVQGIYALRDMDFYQEFAAPDLIFLKDSSIAEGIIAALKTSNTKALGGYAALFFHAEKLSGKQIPQLTALQLLETSTELAISQKDYNALTYLISIWEEPYFGPANMGKAQELRNYMQQAQIQKFKITPSWKVVNTGERIIFKAEEQFSLNDITFNARHGKTWQNLYRAPTFACNDVITATHLPSGQIAKAIVIVKAVSQGKQKAKLKLFFKKKVTPGERIRLRIVKFAGAKRKKVPVADLSFSARYGTMWKSYGTLHYRAPRFACKDVIKIKHLPSQRVIATKIIVANQEEAVPPTNLFTVSDRPRRDAVRFYADRPEMAQLLLSKSEAARVAALEKLVANVRQLLLAHSDFQDISQLALSKESLWAGVITSEPYLYSDKPLKIYVLASTSAKSIIESIRRNCRRNQVEFTEEMQDKLKRLLPETPQVEGSVSLK